MRMADGVLAHFDCGFDFARRSELEVIGAEGTLWLGDPFHARQPGIERRDADGDLVQSIEVPRADSYALQAANFSAAVRGHGAPLLGAEDAVAQARAIEALYRAAETSAGVV
jgi:predicted dehydrogenase